MPGSPDVPVVPVTWRGYGDGCTALGCTRRWASAIPRELIGPETKLRMFGIPDFWFDRTRPPDDSPLPSCLYVCHEHEAALRRRDGTVLGYRKNRRTGRTTAYVQEVLF